MMAQELETDSSDVPTSEDENGFIPLAEIEHAPDPRDRKKVEELVFQLRQVVQRAVHSSHQKPIEIAAAQLKKLGLRLGEKFLDFSSFDEAKKV